MTILSVALPLQSLTLSTELGYVLSGDGRSIAAHGSAVLSLLPRADTLILLVPAQALSWHALKLPPVSAARLRAALEGALEDRLLDEPQQLALAIGPERASEGRACVAACDKHWLRAALQFFEAGGRPASRVLAEFAPSGVDEPARMVVTGTAQGAWLTLVQSGTVVCVPLTCAAALLGQADADLAAAVLIAEPAVAELAEQTLGRPALMQLRAQRLLASSQSDWELAQFDLAISSGGRMARRGAMLWRQLAHAAAWRPMRWGLLLLLLANLAGLNAWAWRQEAALQARRGEIRQLLSRTFPRVKTIIDAPVQMERELALLRQASGALTDRDLEPMLALIGSAVAPGTGPTAIEYAGGETVVKGLALSAQQMASLSARLSVLGYGVRADGDRLVLRAGLAP